MDPFAAIGLAGNIIAFLDFGFKLVSKSKSIHASASGASSHNEDMASLTQHFQGVATNLRVPKPIGSMTGEEVALRQLATECESVSADLIKLLDELKAKNPKSKRESFRAAFRDWRKKDEVSELEVKLDRCRQQLNLQVTSLARSEAMERLEKLVAYGQATEDELRCLNKNVECLRQSSNVSLINPEALNQIRSLLSLTDDAILSVRQARVLDGLRFELMNERFSDIEEAHEKTFAWLLDTNAVSMAGTSSSARSSVKASPEEQPDSDGESDDEDRDDAASDANNDDEVEEPGSSALEGSDANSTGSLYSLRPVDKNCIPTATSQMEQYFYEKFGLDKNSGSTKETDLDDDSNLQWMDFNAPLVEYDRVSFVSSPPRSISSQPYVPQLHPHEHHVSERLLEAMAATRDRFIDWLEQGDGIFHISGKPGSGKSTLMKYICRHSKTEQHLRVWAGDEELVVGQFFFWKPGSTLQKTLKGLIRGLLHYLLKESPNLIPVVFPSQWEASMYKEKIHIEHHECQQGFDALISANAVYRKHKFVFFIDGLDEFDGNHSDLIRRLFGWTKNTRSVKICVSSREWAVFHESFQSCPTFRLHDLTRSDIHRFVADRFSQIDLSALNDSHCESGSHGSASNAQILEQQVVFKSDGVFLWVTLVLRHIEDGLANGDLMDDLMGVVNTLPTELEPMLHQLLGSIPSSNRKLAYGMLALASFCSQYDDHTRLMQYSFMEEYIKDRNFAIHSPVSLLDATENAARLERGKKRIYGICKGFLELRPHLSSCRRQVREVSNMLGDVVLFTHRSIVEFLENQQFQQMMDLELPGFEPFDAYCQTYLGILQRVNLPKFYFAPSVSNQNRRSHVNTGSKAQDFHRLLHIQLFQAPNPSYLNDLSLKIGWCVNLAQKEYLPRFCEFMDSIHRIIVSRKLDTAATCLRTISPNHGLNVDTIIPCNPADMVTLLCAAFGLHEYILHRRSIDPKLLANCIFLSLRGFQEAKDDGVAKVSQEMNNLFNSLANLFAMGGSPDTQLLLRDCPVFHYLLRTWYFYPPCLAVFAFMLYHGVNPRFAIVFSKKQYKALSPSGNLKSVFKTYMTTECPSPESKSKARRARILLQTPSQWLHDDICPYIRPRRSPSPLRPPTTRMPPPPEAPLLIRSLPNVPSAGNKIPPPLMPRAPPVGSPVWMSTDESNRIGTVATVSPGVLDLLNSNGHILSLRNLLPIWFPSHGGVLQQVVDWILDLGTLVDADHRSQLQTKFGHLLRPMFDESSPDFVGWDPPDVMPESEEVQEEPGNKHRPEYESGPSQRHSICLMHVRVNFDKMFLIDVQD